jgi:uncharacterized membrane protein
MFNSTDIEQNQKMAIIANLTWIGLVIAYFSAGKNSAFVKFHCNNCLVATLICFIPIVGSLCGLIFMILGAVNASNSTAKSLPIVGDKLKIIKWE